MTEEEFARYFYPALEVIHQHRLGGVDADYWYDLPETGQGAVEIALERCAAAPDGLDWERHLLTALWCVWEEQAGCVPLLPLRNVQERMEVVLRSSGQDALLAEAGRLCYSAASLYHWQDRIEEAVAGFTRSRALGEATQDRLLLCRGLQGLAACALSRSEFENARAFLRKALEGAEELGAQKEWLRCRLQEGNIEEYMTRYEDAQAIYAEIFSQATSRKDGRLERRVTNCLGNVAQHQGRYAEGLRFYERARAISAELAQVETNYSIDAIIASNESSLLFETEQPDLGLKKAREAAALFAQAGKASHEASALINLASHEIILAQYAAAHPHLVKAITLASDRKLVRVVAFALAEFVRLYDHFDYDEARVTLFGAIAALYASIGSQVPHNQQINYNQNQNHLLRKLGQARFDAAWQNGMQMTVPQAVAFAIAVPLPIS